MNVANLVDDEDLFLGDPFYNTTVLLSVCCFLIYGLESKGDVELFQLFSVSYLTLFLLLGLILGSAFALDILRSLTTI
jgi:hypothetical protein